MSRDACLMCGLALVLVPTIVYGGLTLLGVLTGGSYGAPAPKGLSPLQASLYRAGHAHAGVLTILGLALQALLDHSSLPLSLVWSARVGALTAPLFVAGGFFGTAHLAGLSALLYLGAAAVAATTLTVGIGLLRASW
jgi:hypothetical protein